MTGVLGEQVLELGKKLLGHVGSAPKLPEVRNDSPLRFNVALALCDMALRHFQFGLAVHLGDITPNAPG